MRILDLTLLDDRPIQEWMPLDDRPYDAARVPPGALLTLPQFAQWVRLSEESAARADAYARRIADAAAFAPTLEWMDLDPLAFDEATRARYDEAVARGDERAFLFALARAGYRCPPQTQDAPDT